MIKRMFSKFVVFALLAANLWAADLNEVKTGLLEQDERNLNVSFELSVKGTALVLSINDLDGKATQMDAFRILSQTAVALKHETYEEVLLAFRGESRFKVTGEAFAQLAADYQVQKPTYILRTWPEKVLTLEGENAFEEHRGGLLYLLRVQMADFSTFNAQWYLDDLLAESKAEMAEKMPTEYKDDEAF